MCNKEDIFWGKMKVYYDIENGDCEKFEVVCLFCLLGCKSIKVFFIIYLEW